MNRQKALIALKTRLGSIPSERQKVLIDFLPQEEKNFLDKLPSYPSIPSFSPCLLEEIHWSWFLPALRKYSKKEQALLSQALGGLSQESLEHELSLKRPKEPLSPSLRSFFQKLLFESLFESQEPPFPKELLPSSPLSFLLLLEKKELISLIDGLSLYDLSHEIKQTVETKTLKALYRCLDPKEIAFLSHLSPHKDPYPISRFLLDGWDGTEELLRHLLHKKGIARLGSALSGQDPDLIWHLSRRLDIGRGSALIKSVSKEVLPQMSEWAIHQVEEVRRHLGEL